MCHPGTRQTPLEVFGGYLEGRGTPMKRTATAAVAAATALSIVAAPAFAEENAATGEAKETSSIADTLKSSDKDREGSSQDGEKASSIKGSSDIDDDAARNYYDKKKDEQSALFKRIVGDKDGEQLNDALKPFTSSLKADAAQEWNPGTTLNILIGVGVVAALLGIANAGVIPGLSLPSIPLPF